MAPINGSIEISRPPQDVFDYVGDLSKHTEWQSGLESVQVETEGPTRVGTRAQETRHLPGGNQTYHYEITNALGQPVCGSAGAESLPALAAQFAEQGWKVQRVLPDAAPAPFRYGRRVSNAEISTFLRQLAVMLRNQVPVPEAVALLARECRNPVFQTLLYGVERQVRAGEPLSAALARYPRLFAPMQTATIEAGEASNSLERVAEKLADYSEVVGMGVRRIRTAALYPLVVWCITSALILFVFAFIVPKYDALMRDLGMKELPLITQILVSASQSIVPIGIIAALPALLLGAVTLGMQRGSGAWRLDAWRLRLPVIGRLVESLALFRLSAMLSSEGTKPGTGRSKSR